MTINLLRDNLWQASFNWTDWTESILEFVIFANVGDVVLLDESKSNLF